MPTPSHHPSVIPSFPCPNADPLRFEAAVSLTPISPQTRPPPRPPDRPWKWVFLTILSETVIFYSLCLSSFQPLCLLSRPGPSHLFVLLTVSRMALYFAGVADCFTDLYLKVTRRANRMRSRKHQFVGLGSIPEHLLANFSPERELPKVLGR